MDLKLLIDAIVHQTMVLIAQLSTTQGVRSPLAHVADQVFLELTRELENQGVRRQIAADMFGIALRSYQKKVQRLTQGASEHDRSLWQAVLEFIEQHQPTRQRISERFQYDGERELAAVIQDLLRSGLIFTTGSGTSALFGLTSPKVREVVQTRHDVDALSNLVWLKVFYREATSRQQLSETFTGSPEILAAALAELLANGRVRDEEGTLRATNLVVPLGAAQGWESAIVDHFRSVATAIAQKVRSGARGSDSDDRVGGATFGFTVVPGHPHEAEVYQLLSTTRAAVQALWDKVSRHNEAHPPDPEKSVRVSFYVGQSMNNQEEADSE